MQKGNEFRVHVRCVFKRYLLCAPRSVKNPAFPRPLVFRSLLPRSAIVVDFGAHHGQFFAALKSDYSLSRALLVEANPALADPLKKTFAGTDVLHAALIGGNNRIVSHLRGQLSSNLQEFLEWAAAWSGDQWKLELKSSVIKESECI